MVNNDYVDEDPFVLKGEGLPVESINNFLLMGGLLEGEIDIKVPDRFSNQIWSNVEAQQKARFCKFTLQNMSGINSGGTLQFNNGQGCIIKSEIFIQMLDQVEKLQFDGTTLEGLTVNVLKNYPVVTADDILIQNLDLSEPVVNLLHSNLINDSFYFELISDRDDVILESITLTVKTKKLDGIGDFGINRAALEGGDLFPLHETDLDSDLQTKVNIGGSGTTVNPYPVGSIYLSVNNTNPATLFGGTWEQLKNQFLLAADDATNGAHGGDTGGEKEHTLSINEMPIHKHDVDSATQPATNTANTSPGTSSNGSHTHDMPYGAKRTNGPDDVGYGVNPAGYWGNVIPASGAHAHTVNAHAHQVPAHDHAILEQNKGADESHNNMPPYLAVYMWKRTG